jgi:hypothetical protein
LSNEGERNRQILASFFGGGEEEYLNDPMAGRSDPMCRSDLPLRAGFSLAGEFRLRRRSRF